MYIAPCRPSSLTLISPRNCPVFTVASNKRDGIEASADAEEDTEEGLAVVVEVGRTEGMSYSFEAVLVCSMARIRG